MHLENEDFKKKGIVEVVSQGEDKNFISLSEDWMKASATNNYSYHFEWLGLPIIQYPQDIVAMQQIIWNVKPDLIIETGVARGGSVIFYAGMLELISSCNGNSDARILGIDIEIRKGNYEAISNHPLSKRIDLIEGSSIDHDIYEKVKEYAKNYKKILVCLDSNHTHEHVFQELMLYSKFVSKGSYCVVFDTIVEKLPGIFDQNRAWGSSNNPQTAVDEYLKRISINNLLDFDGKPIKFSVDRNITNSIMITVAPGGYLLRD
jgi:cephalosporin hydroxylase